MGGGHTWFVGLVWERNDQEGRQYLKIYIYRHIHMIVKIDIGSVCI